MNADELHALRRSLRLTQQALAVELGIARNTVARMEARNEHALKIPKAIELAVLHLVYLKQTA